MVGAGTPTIPTRRNRPTADRFLGAVHELEHIVLITHFGFAVYAERLKKTPDECLPVQIQVRIATDTRCCGCGIRTCK